jgi:hypothetical protein
MPPLSSVVELLAASSGGCKGVRDKRGMDATTGAT